MKLKLDENGNAVLQDGKPVYVMEDGKEVVFDAPQMYSKITALTTESKSHRDAKEAAEAKLKAFEGIDDAEAARKALQTVAALDDKKLVDAGKVEEIKAAAVRAHEEQSRAAAEAHARELKTVKDELSNLRNTYNGEKISGAFKGSKYIADKFAIPADIAEARFGRHFSVGEDGAIVAKRENGSTIYSTSRPGENADFEEAIETLVSEYAHRDAILKGTGQSGGGAQGSNADGRAPAGKQQGSFGGSKEDRVKAIASKFPDLARASA